MRRKLNSAKTAEETFLRAGTKASPAEGCWVQMAKAEGSDRGGDVPSGKRVSFACSPHTLTVSPPALAQATVHHIVCRKSQKAGNRPLLQKSAVYMERFHVQQRNLPNHNKHSPLLEDL